MQAVVDEQEAQPARKEAHVPQTCPLRAYPPEQLRHTEGEEQVAQPTSRELQRVQLLLTSV